MSAEKKIEVIKISNIVKVRETKTREEMKDTLVTVISQVLGVCDGVEVSYWVGERTTVYEVKCPMDQLGRLIGAKGKNVTALRTLLSAMASVHNIRAILEIPYRPAPAKG